MIIRLIDTILHPDYASRNKSDDMDNPAYEIYENGGVNLHEAELNKRMQKAEDELRRKSQGANNEVEG